MKQVLQTINQIYSNQAITGLDQPATQIFLKIHFAVSDWGLVLSSRVTEAVSGGRGGCLGWGSVPPGAPGEISEGPGVPAGVQIKRPSAGDSKALRTAGNQLRFVQTVHGKQRNVKIQDSRTHIPLSHVPCYVSVPILFSVYGSQTVTDSIQNLEFRITCYRALDVEDGF